MEIETEWEGETRHLVPAAGYISVNIPDASSNSPNRPDRPVEAKVERKVAAPPVLPPPPVGSVFCETDNELGFEPSQISAIATRSALGQWGNS